MRAAAAVLSGILLSCSAANAREQLAAIFDFELTDTSRENQLAPHDAEHQARLALVTERLRTKLAESGRFSVVDIAPVAKEARASNLQACGGCDVTLAQQVGAELSVTGMVFKISNLILNMTIFVRDAKTGRSVAVAQASLRGDTDESWRRTLDWLVRYRLLDADLGVPQ
ncbi:MAG TPA: DUF3280 domain-containing protein [Xanthobacteraceae bacterium]|jgi:hypothetical protein|nr:DUF3280 domain-containing protein [Xanthobacteraceae bacterium]